MDAGRIEVSLSQDKTDHINSIHQTESEYWKKAAFKRVLDQNDTKKWEDLAPPSLFLTRGAIKNVKNAKKTDINEIIFYLKLQYSGDENQVVFIQSYRSMHFLEKILEEMKVISKYVKETENMSLKNNLFGEWLSNARSRYKNIRKKDLPTPFDEWVHKECGIGKQTMHNYINLCKLMRVAPKLSGCRVNMNYFIKHHKNLMTCFQNERQIPWKHQFDCTCDDCNTYFFGMEFLV